MAEVPMKTSLREVNIPPKIGATPRQNHMALGLETNSNWLRHLANNLKSENGFHDVKRVLRRKSRSVRSKLLYVTKEVFHGFKKLWKHFGTTLRQHFHPNPLSLKLYF